MYLKHFGFAAAPFAINPDPRFLFLSPQHQEALAHLLYGLGEGGGFVMLSGEVGTGKTTLCYSLLEQMGGDVDVAFIMNPRLSGTELLAALCDELHIPYPSATESRKVLIDALNHFLLANHARGRRTVAVIDEAQNLGVEVLEQVRLLTNLETPTTKLLQIILVGQPELSDLLGRRDVRQVDQRITARYHLGPLNAAETRSYVAHRLTVAGGDAGIFSASALAELFVCSKGVPRLINIICDRALLGAYALDRKRVDRAIVRKASTEAHRRPNKPPRALWISAAAMSFAALASASMIQSFTAMFPERTIGQLTPPSEQPPPVTVTTPELAAPTTPESRPADTPPEGSPGPVAEPAVTPLVPQPPFAEWLAGSSFQEAGALGRLTQLWRRDQAFRPLSCGELAGLGLGCLRLRASWDRLQRQNLPAVMRFKRMDGSECSVVLADIVEQRVNLLSPDGVSTPFLLRDILPLWTGDVLVVFEPLANGVQVLSEGMAHPAVPMLREQLNAAGFDARPLGAPEIFDRPMTASVIGFQRSIGATADGLVGSETLAALTAIRPRPGLPRLSEPRGRRSEDP